MAPGWYSLALLGSFALGLTAQDLAPEALLLARIKVRAAENLQKLPNYTCLETIERSRRPASGRRFELSDVVRLEVGYVDRKEVFAWPGSGKFEDKDITDMVSGGTIGNGSFALHVNSVFLGDGASFTYVGERIREGKTLIRYDYRVPMFRSGFQLRVRPAVGVVGYHGAFWVEPNTLDLVRLEIIADEIPPHLPVLSAVHNLVYQKALLGGAPFLLPQEGEMILTDLKGNESRNRLTFTNCRQFAGESVLSFEDAPETPAGPVSAAPQPVTLPADLDVELALESPIVGGTTAVGDTVVARVHRDVKRKGEVLIPKGATALGRVTHMSSHKTPTSTGWYVGVDFRRIEFDNRYAPFHGRMNTAPERLAPARSGMIVTEVTPALPLLDPRVGILYIRGETGKLAAGKRTNWRTALPSAEE